MNEPYDPMEAELEAMKPHGMSPELRQRIANELESEVSPRPRGLRPHRRLWGAALTIGLVAACLSAVVFLWLRDREETVENAPAGEPSPHSSASVPDDALPTLWTYRSALTRSPQAVEALLDRHARIGSRADPEETQIHAFTRLEVRFQDLKGGL
jgi:hypothetical protein